MSIKYRRQNGTPAYKEDVEELLRQYRNKEIADDVTEEEIRAAFDRGDEVSPDNTHVQTGQYQDCVSNCYSPAET
jgi:hypothetical protein